MNFTVDHTPIVIQKTIHLISQVIISIKKIRKIHEQSKISIRNKAYMGSWSKYKLMKTYLEVSILSLALSIWINFSPFRIKDLVVDRNFMLDSTKVILLNPFPFIGSTITVPSIL